MSEKFELIPKDMRDDIKEELMEAQKEIEKNQQMIQSLRFELENHNMRFFQNFVKWYERNKDKFEHNEYEFTSERVLKIDFDDWSRDVTKFINKMCDLELDLNPTHDRLGELLCQYTDYGYVESENDDD
jgi:hypothetical protein